MNKTDIQTYIHMQKPEQMHKRKATYGYKDTDRYIHTQYIEKYKCITGNRNICIKTKAQINIQNNIQTNINIQIIIRERRRLKETAAKKMIENEFPSGFKYAILLDEEGTARGERNFCQGHFLCKGVKP